MGLAASTRSLKRALLLGEPLARRDASRTVMRAELMRVLLLLLRGAGQAD